MLEKCHTHTHAHAGIKYPNNTLNSVFEGVLLYNTPLHASRVHYQDFNRNQPMMGTVGIGGVDSHRSRVSGGWLCGWVDELG